jgi:vancomycin resistance protein YoaR
VASYTPGQIGRSLDITDTRSRLLSPLTSFRGARVELLIHDIVPAIYDEPEVVARIQQIIESEGLTLYMSAPQDGEDLERMMLPPEDLIRWLRVEVINLADGTSGHRVFLDENAVRQWLSQYAEQIYRPPINARFYFDDATRELVLVAPHANGRELDVEATLKLIQEQAGTPNRSVPFVVNEIVPSANSNVTAAELGITELISEGTTWFRGSSDARKRNIAQAAANFYGIVIAPGEEFSFNKYLGSISEADGYEEGLIIVGGQTIKGIGGESVRSARLSFKPFFGLVFLLPSVGSMATCWAIIMMARVPAWMPPFSHLSSISSL